MTRFFLGGGGWRAQDTSLEFQREGGTCRRARNSKGRGGYIASWNFQMCVCVCGGGGEVNNAIWVGVWIF